jgi:hypothetical protein
MNQTFQNNTVRGEAALSPEGHPATSQFALQSPLSYVARLSSLRQQRIQAGIMITDARLLKGRHFEWRSYYYEAFDVFARELLEGASDPEVLLQEVIPQLVFDEAVRLRWPTFCGSAEPDENHTMRYGSHWANPEQILWLKSTLEGPAQEWRGRHLLRYGNRYLPVESARTIEEVVRQRGELLANYKKRTGVRTNAAIYNAKNSGFHKPDFYRWRSGKLLATTATATSLENFLRAGERPKPRKIRN